MFHTLKTCIDICHNNTCCTKHTCCSALHTWCSLILGIRRIVTYSCTSYLLHQAHLLQCFAHVVQPDSWHKAYCYLFVHLSQSLNHRSLKLKGTLNSVINHMLSRNSCAWVSLLSEDCFYYCSEINNVVVLFGTFKVQSFILTEVSDCGLLIVVTSSTFLKRKDMIKEKGS